MSTCNSPTKKAHNVEAHLSMLRIESSMPKQSMNLNHKCQLFCFSAYTIGTTPRKMELASECNDRKIKEDKKTLSNNF